MPRASPEPMRVMTAGSSSSSRVASTMYGFSAAITPTQISPAGTSRTSAFFSVYRAGFIVSVLRQELVDLVEGLHRPPAGAADLGEPDAPVLFEGVAAGG